MIRVADYIANYIYDELKVKHVFMVTGAGIMHLTDGVASHMRNWRLYVLTMNKPLQWQWMLILEPLKIWV